MYIIAHGGVALWSSRTEDPGFKSRQGLSFLGLAKIRLIVVHVEM
jgi:hypothetical protein